MKQEEELENGDHIKAKPKNFQRFHAWDILIPNDLYNIISSFVYNEVVDFSANTLNYKSPEIISKVIYF